MSFLDNLLCCGRNYPAGNSWGIRLSCRIGRFLAQHHGRVEIALDARISADARLHAREGQIRIGHRSLVAPGAIVQGNVRIGDDCSIQNYTMLVGYGSSEDDAGLISVGNGVRIAAHGMIVAANHRFDRPDLPIHQQGMQFASIWIGDDVWIGANCCILAGVSIGSGSVIGAGSVVTRDIPPMSIAVGNPAKVIRNRREISRRTTLP